MLNKRCNFFQVNKHWIYVRHIMNCVVKISDSEMTEESNTFLCQLWTPLLQREEIFVKHLTIFRFPTWDVVSAEVLAYAKPLLSENKVPSIWHVKTVITLQKIKSEHLWKKFILFIESLYCEVSKHMDNIRTSLNLKPETKCWTDGKCLFNLGKKSLPASAISNLRAQQKYPK